VQIRANRSFLDVRVLASANAALAAGRAFAASTRRDTSCAAFSGRVHHRGAALAGAMVADSSHLTSASFVAIPPFGTPNAVADRLSFLPTAGPNFAILSTGDATIADDPNGSGSSGANDGGPNVGGNTDFDVTTLAIDLNVSPAISCVQFDFASYSEEFPEYVGSQFNDAFIAELDNTSWTTSGSQISAPDNFAFDVEGHPVTINSTGVTAMSELNASNTTYDGATVLL
jgi:hypothetical protein